MMKSNKSYKKCGTPVGTPRAHFRWSDDDLCLEHRGLARRAAHHARRRDPTQGFRLSAEPFDFLLAPRSAHITTVCERRSFARVVCWSRVRPHVVAFRNLRTRKGQLISKLAACMR